MQGTPPTTAALIEEVQTLRPRSRFCIVYVACPYCGGTHDHVWSRTNRDHQFTSPCAHGPYVLEDYLGLATKETQS